MSYHISNLNRLRKMTMRFPMGSCYCVRIRMKKVAMVALPGRWQRLCIATKLTNDQ